VLEYDLSEDGTALDFQDLLPLPGEEAGLEVESVEPMVDEGDLHFLEFGSLRLLLPLANNSIELELPKQVLNFDHLLPFLLLQLGVGQPSIKEDSHLASSAVVQLLPLFFFLLGAFLSFSW